jgi:lysozyme
MSTASSVFVDASDVITHPWKWTQISAATAHLRSAHVPVVAVYTMQGRSQAVLVGTGWATDLACSLVDAPGTKFYVLVGTKHPGAARSPVRTRMNLSSAGADFIGKGYENPSQKGYKVSSLLYFPYDDGYGYSTIGYGHLIKPGEDFSKGLTAAQVTQLFQADIAGTVTRVNSALKVGVSQSQFDALVSLSFNIGKAASHPVRVLNAGGAVRESEFTIYDHVKVNGKATVSQGLLARRKAEWNIFSKNIYNASH